MSTRRPECGVTPCHDGPQPLRSPDRTRVCYSPAPMGTTSSRWGQPLAALGGVAVLLAGLLAGWARVGGGTGGDFAVLHAMGVGVLRGANVYALNAAGEARTYFAGASYPPGRMGVVVYPPATGFLMAALAPIPYHPAWVLWFVVENVVLVLGIRSLVRALVPEARTQLWTLAAGLILLSAGIRWGMMLLQGAPLVLGLLCYFLAHLNERRPQTSAALAIVATAFKITLALPFLGLLLLHRRFRAVVAAVGTWVVLNVVGFWRMGGDSFVDYRTSTAAFEAIAPQNINSPNPWSIVSLPRLDWVSALYGLSGDAVFARVTSAVCALGAAGWIIYEGLRLRQRPGPVENALFVTPLICLGSLSVYHHQYDLCLFFAPVLLLCLGPRVLRTPVWAVSLDLPLIAMLAVLPIGAAGDALFAVGGASGVAILKLAFPACLTLAFVGSLAALHVNVARTSLQKSS